MFFFVGPEKVPVFFRETESGEGSDFSVIHYRVKHDKFGGKHGVMYGFSFAPVVIPNPKPWALLHVVLPCFWSLFFYSVWENELQSEKIVMKSLTSHVI